MIHFLDKESDLLKLQAQRGIPAFLLPKMTEFLLEKVWQALRLNGVSQLKCVIYRQTIGVLYVPQQRKQRWKALLLFRCCLMGTLGIAKAVPYDFTEEEKSSLMMIGEERSRYIRAHAGIDSL